MYQPFILHVSADFPDTVEPFKTKVVGTLLSLTDHAFRHRVVSLNRVSPTSAGLLKEVAAPVPLKIQEHAFDRGVAVSYEAPSKGVRHLTKNRHSLSAINSRLKVLRYSERRKGSTFPMPFRS